MFRCLKHYGMSIVGQTDKYVVYSDGVYRFAVSKADLERFDARHADYIPGYTSCFCKEVPAFWDETVLLSILEETTLNYVQAGGTCRSVKRL